MFIGHYGAGLVARRADDTIPLWVLFVAALLLDVLWATLVLLGVEKVRIVPGITATNPLDLYYVPYTHSLLAAGLWALACGLAYRFAFRPRRTASAVIVGLVVLSHWFLDLVVHRPDLPLYDDSAKVGLGLWNLPVLAFAVEALLLFVGIWLCTGRDARLRPRLVALGLVMLAMQGSVFFGRPPDTPALAAGTALFGYAALTLAVWFLADRRRSAASVAHVE